MKKFLFSLGLTLFVGWPAFAAALVVTKTADTNDGVCDGDCSLREAVAVAQPGDVIQFAGGGIGVHQLATEALPINKENITIDGGANHPVVIRGKHAEFVAAGNIGRSFNCFTVTSSNNTLKGLVMQNCYSGISIFGATRDAGGGRVECLASKGNKIENNYIGTNSAGDGAAGNYFGLRIYNGQENIVGPGNVVSGNIFFGLYLDQPCTQLNRVEGNLIGLKADGAGAIPNMRVGVLLNSGATANIIGGETPEQRNIISGNNWFGIQISYSSSFNQIVGNYIGLDKEGKKAIVNSRGIHIGNDQSHLKSVSNRISGNVISGQVIGLALIGVSTENNIVEKNIIGLGADLQPITGLEQTGAGVGNAEYGIVIRANHNIIGGEKLEDANIIANNFIYGIFLGEIRYNIDNIGTMHSDGPSTGNKFLYNSIFNNGRDGIKFDPAGLPSHNNISKPGNFAAPDADPPVADEVALRGNGAKPQAAVFLYEADASNSCEGKTFIAQIQAGENGEWETKLTGRFNDAGTNVVALQQVDADGFSEFSNCFTIENKPPRLEDIGNRGVTETEELAFNLHAVDANGNGLGYSCDKDCPEGLTVGDDGQVKWTPKRGDGGKPYNITFAATDGIAKDEKIANIVVERFDTTPQLAELENRIISEKDSLSFSLEAADEDGDAPTFVFSQGQREGMTFDAQTGAFSWSPKKEDVGEHRLVFRAVDNDKEILFTEKEMKIEVKRKFPPPAIEIKKLKVVRAGEKVSLVVQLKEQLAELQYTFRWEVKDGEGGIVSAGGPEAEYTAPITAEDVQEQVKVVVEDSDGNISEETVNVVVLAKSAENPNIETPTTTGGDDTLGNTGATGGAGGTETEAGGEAKAKDFEGTFQCALNRNASPSNQVNLLWLLPMVLLAGRSYLKKNRYY